MEKILFSLFLAFSVFIISNKNNVINAEVLSEVVIEDNNLKESQVELCIDKDIVLDDENDEGIVL